MARQRQSVFLRSLSLEYDYAELSSATLNWDASRKLGAGAFGAVFRGELEDASEVAIKLIDLAALIGSGQDPNCSGFEEEVRVLSKFRHPNLVTLLGWGKKDMQRYLIYELMPGGDVSDRLAKSKSGQLPFQWHERLAVLLDSASGLSHMHNSKPKVFHRDIKSANILLDKNGTSKMADFGLSFESWATDSAVQNASGTPGYICPLYARRCVANAGSDVYSFGMVILELILGLTPAVADPRQPGGIGYPVGHIIAPSNPRIGGFEPGALERCMANLDHTAAYPRQVAEELCTLGLRSVNTMDERQRPATVDMVWQIRAMIKACPKDRFMPNGNIGQAQSQPSTPMSPYSARSNGGYSGVSSDVPTRVMAPTAQSSSYVLELIFATGIAVEALPPDMRQIVLIPDQSNPAMSVAGVGRKHQSNIFEAWLPDQTLRESISRCSFEVSWGPGGRPMQFTTKGSNQLAVEGRHVRKNTSVPLEIGRDIGFLHSTSASDVFLVLRLQVSTVAMPPQSPRPMAPTGMMIPATTKQWRLVCVFVNGMLPDVLQKLPVDIKSFGLMSGLNSIGRQHQPNTFTTLLNNSQGDFTKISRTHITVTVDPASGVVVTNMSNWPLLVGDKALSTREAAPLHENDVLSFTRMDDGNLSKIMSLQVTLGF